MSTNDCAASAPASSSDPLDPRRRWSGPDGLHIDVRGLLPPGPLVAILALVDSAPAATSIIVHHDRDPKLLHPELAERRWIATTIDAPPGEVWLKLERAP